MGKLKTYLAEYTSRKPSKVVCTHIFIADCLRDARDQAQVFKTFNVAEDNPLKVRTTVKLKR